MARIVKEAEYAGKRNEILDAAQNFVYTKGYERMTIQDILDELQISKGAFYHYFDSKPEILEALTEREQHGVEQAFLEIVRNPDLSALEKLHGFFTTLDRLRIAHKTTVVEMLRVWYTDDNAIVRQKIDAAVLERRAPLLAEIVHQGIKEGIFTVSYPDQAGEIIASLMANMGNSHAKLLLAFDKDHDESRCIKGIIAVHTAYMDAIERVLGAPLNSLYRVDAEAAKFWLSALGVNT